MNVTFHGDDPLPFPISDTLSLVVNSTLLLGIHLPLSLQTCFLYTIEIKSACMPLSRHSNKVNEISHMRRLTQRVLYCLSSSKKDIRIMLCHNLVIIPDTKGV